MAIDDRLFFSPVRQPCLVFLYPHYLFPYYLFIIFANLQSVFVEHARTSQETTNGDSKQQ